MASHHQFTTDHRSFLEPLSVHVNALSLSGTAKTATLDVSDHNIIRVTCTGNGAWFKVNGTAAVPGGDITDESASEFLPPNQPRFFVISGVTSLSFILHNGACLISYALFHHAGY